METESDACRISTEGVCFSYRPDEEILKDVGVKVGFSETLGIIGPNGSGKSTLMKCLNRILTPIQGEILLNGSDIANMKRSAIARDISYVPQHVGSDMAFPNVYDVVMMGRRPHTSWGYTEKDSKIVWDTMKYLDIAHLASKGFDQLSSGQTQRVLLARAIAQEAKVLLLDEPTSNLDIKYQIEVMSLVNSIVKTKKVSACTIVHDLDLALRFCDRVVLLCEGRILVAGPAKEVMKPEHIFEAYGVEVSIENVCGRERIIVV